MSHHAGYSVVAFFFRSAAWKRSDGYVYLCVRGIGGMARGTSGNVSTVFFPYCSIRQFMLYFRTWNNRVAGWADLSFLGMGVML
jgi:hypothetical protein